MSEHLTLSEVAKKAEAYADSLWSVEGLKAALLIIADNVRTAPASAPPEASGLRGALEGCLAYLWPTAEEGHTGFVDRLGMQFYEETRIWPPFKSAPMEAAKEPTPEDSKAWRAWLDAKRDAAAAAAVAALAATPDAPRDDGEWLARYHAEKASYGGASFEFHARAETWIRNRAATPDARPEPRALNDDEIETLVWTLVNEGASRDSERQKTAMQRARVTLRRLPSPAQAPAHIYGPAFARLMEQKDGAYRERDQVVALAARMALLLGWRAGLRSHEPDPDPAWDDDWKNVVAIDLPTGQVTWHLHDSERPLFHSLPPYDGSWDGHDTSEKYRRVNGALAASPEEKP